MANSTRSAHPILRDLGVNRAKPDLLVHTPGAMAGNYAIIEVKHSTATDGILKDLQILDLFMRKVGYRRAIYLIYGHKANAQGVEEIEAIAKKFQELGPIELWLHSTVGQPATHKTTLHLTHLHNDMARNQKIYPCPEKGN